MAELSPEWLDNDFFTDCLRNESNNPNLQVTDFKVESAVPPGNNYGSIVARVKLNYKDKTNPQIGSVSKTLIVKLPLTQGTIKELLGDSLDVEPIFYKDYLPKVYALLKNDFAPKYYPSSSTRPVVVLEDLKEAGFVMADRKKMLDLDNCLRYAEAAAAFHGGSIPVFKNHPELATRLCKEKLLSNDVKIKTSTENMIKYGLASMADRVLKMTGDSRIPRILKACLTIIWDLLVDAVKPKGRFNTINQGDPWLTNMMFKYDEEGRCVAMKILDYQGLRCASPATDLVFFLWSSARHYVREENFEKFIQTYVEAMNRNLEEMNCSERLSMDFFKEELLRASPLALYACTMLPLVPVMEKVDVNGIFAQCEHEFDPENNPLDELYTEDFCNNDLPRLVNQLEKLKIFDYLETCLAKKK